MIFSLLDRPDACKGAIADLSQAADQLVKGQHEEATRLVLRSDVELLTNWYIESQTGSIVFGRHGITPSVADPGLRCVDVHTAADARTIYERDGWHCRFCQCPVIDPGARTKFGQLLPELRWGRTNRTRHGGVLVHMASVDHVLPRSWGGTNGHDNLVTACWPCQFSRGDALIEECSMTDPRDRPAILNDWDGLRRVLTISCS